MSMHVLLGPDHALQHRVDRLQVARVGHQRGRDRRAVAGGVLPSAPRWYLTSPEPCVVRRVEVALELLEDLRVRLAHDVREHVQPAAVRHADDGLVQLARGPPR